MHATRSIDDIVIPCIILLSQWWYQSSNECLHTKGCGCAHQGVLRLWQCKANSNQTIICVYTNKGWLGYVFVKPILPNSYLCIHQKGCCSYGYVKTIITITMVMFGHHTGDIKFKTNVCKRTKWCQFYIHVWPVFVRIIYMCAYINKCCNSCCCSYVKPIIMATMVD